MNIGNILKLFLNPTRCAVMSGIVWILVSYINLAMILKQENFSGGTPASTHKGTACCLKSEK